jgi:BMFP domain-containing protein YqiC
LGGAHRDGARERGAADHNRARKAAGEAVRESVIPLLEGRHVDQDILKDIDRRVREMLAQSPAADLEKNLRALLASFFARLDLVTREEFDVQRQVLLRTREKLAQLEAQVAELERNLENPGQTPIS